MKILLIFCNQFIIWSFYPSNLNCVRFVCWYMSPLFFHRNHVLIFRLPRFSGSRMTLVVVGFQLGVARGRKGEHQVAPEKRQGVSLDDTVNTPSMFQQLPGKSQPSFVCPYWNALQQYREPRTKKARLTKQSSAFEKGFRGHELADLSVGDPPTCKLKPRVKIKPLIFPSSKTPLQFQKANFNRILLKFKKFHTQFTLDVGK